MTRPPFAYYGGKQILAEKLIALMPPHEHYVEPFAGSLSVLLAKPRATMETVNDLDHELIAFWQILRDSPSDLERAMWLTPHARQEHGDAKDLDASTTDLERARRVWVRLSQGRAGRRGSTGWKHYQDAKGSTRGMPDYLAAYCERVAPGSARLHGVSLECRPAVDVVRDYGRHTTTLLYVDPPYFGDRATGYEFEMKAEADHLEMLQALTECSARVLLSGYATDLYDKVLADWTRVEIDTWTGQGGVRESRTEVVWMNYQIGAQQGDLFEEVSA